MDPEHIAARSPSVAPAVPLARRITVPGPPAAEGGAPAPEAPVPAGGGPGTPGARGPSESPPGAHWAPESYALLSALIPGAGQAAQGRWVAAALQAATVATYLASALAVGGHAFWLALGWNAWSAVDAYRHERD